MYLKASKFELNKFKAPVWNIWGLVENMRDILMDAKNFLWGVIYIKKKSGFHM